MRRSKLTLSVEKDLIEKAKKLALQQGTSLSSMFSRFLSTVLSGNSGMFRSGPSSKKVSGRAKIRIGPITRKLAGSVKFPPGKTDRELIEEALGEKYGL
jgi:hypothetical protein